KEPIDNFDELISRAANKSDIERIKEAVQGKIDALAPGDERIRQYQAKLQKVNDIEKQYSLSATSKSQKDTEKWGEKRTDILQKIAEKEDDVIAKGMAQNDRELQEARNHYAELRRIIDEHNRKAPESQRIGAGVLSRLDKIEKRETG